MDTHPEHWGESELIVVFEFEAFRTESDEYGGENADCAHVQEESDRNHHRRSAVEEALHSVDREGPSVDMNDVMGTQVASSEILVLVVVIEWVNVGMGQLFKSCLRDCPDCVIHCSEL